MNHPLGQTRTWINRNHAVLAPDSRLFAPLVTWTNTQIISLISPQLGAGFHQYEAVMASESSSAMPLEGVERFIFVVQGHAEMALADRTFELYEGAFAYIPPNFGHEVESNAGCRLMMFERNYVALDDVNLPDIVVDHIDNLPSIANEGDPDAQLKRLLPIADAFDIEMNIFTFQPGACLPQVEVHLPEHGLLMLEGAGIYRLDSQWYPVQAGDVIWMGPYCPQWFCAVGKSPASYLYYKDVRRDPLSL
jgi:(S)-ureidoglycine aminohydrolase